MDDISTAHDFYFTLNHPLFCDILHCGIRILFSEPVTRDYASKRYPYSAEKAVESYVALHYSLGVYGQAINHAAIPEGKYDNKVFSYKRAVWTAWGLKRIIQKEFPWKLGDIYSEERGYFVARSEMEKPWRQASDLEIIKFDIVHKYCSHCGFILPRSLHFCPECGKDLRSEYPRQSPVPPPPIFPQVPHDIRTRHLFIPGFTGGGKSTLFLNQAIEDIEEGYGICVIDPKGDLVKKLACYIPPSRLDDAIYLDLDAPIPLDFMASSGRDQKEALIGNLKYIVTKGLSAEHAPLMAAILEDVIYTLLSANENPKIPPSERATFLDIHNFLEYESRREQIKKYAEPKFQLKWTPERMPNPKDRRPVISRMTSFVNSDSLSAIFGTPNPKLDISYCMDNRKIILVDLAGVGQSKMIYGALLVAKIQQAAFARHSIEESQRVPFYLYVDEFENFQTSSFHHIIAQARGYNLGLTVGCQWLDQLDKNNESALFTVASYIMFGMSPKDASKFKSLIQPHSPDELVKMPQHHALYVINRAAPILSATPPPPPDPTPEQRSHADYIRKRTLELYSCKSEPMTHTSVDGKQEPPDPQPTDDARKAGGVGNPSAPLRSPEQRRGSATPPPLPNKK